MKYIIALDQGTTSTRAIIFNGNGGIASSASREFRQIYPKAGWVEHDAEEIFVSAAGVIKEALLKADIKAADVAAMGITNQRETTIVWNRFTGEPVCNAIVWQCRRTAQFCEGIKNKGLAPLIEQKTGLLIDPYFSATKLKWIADNVSGAAEGLQKGDLLFGTVDTYLLWKFTGGKVYATDYTNASRTMLFDIHNLCWDKELLSVFGIHSGISLPEVKPSGAFYGKTDKDIFGCEIPICGIAGDQQSALFGQLCIKEGDVKNTYGTGCFLLMNAGKKPCAGGNGLITTLCAGTDDKPQFALEGSVFIGGAVVQWLRDGLGFIQTAAESEALALTVKDSGGVYVVPAFTGLGAPYWDADARGTVTGITRGTTRAHIVRAALEGIAYQVNDVLRAMETAAGVKVSRLAVDGGASANNFLMAFQADISRCEVARPEVAESTAKGAAYLAGLACGLWSMQDLRGFSCATRTFSPNMKDDERAAMLSGWRNAVNRTLSK
ncbi:MAG: glycerol kinase GlpK [Clostridia bacterium]|nr:glycerol kinase GlpK [Clostridia bacterium]